MYVNDVCVHTRVNIVKAIRRSIGIIMGTDDTMITKYMHKLEPVLRSFMSYNIGPNIYAHL